MSPLLAAPLPLLAEILTALCATRSLHRVHMDGFWKRQIAMRKLGYISLGGFWKKVWFKVSVSRFT